MKGSAAACRDSCDVLESPLGPVYLVFRSSVLTGITFVRPQGITFRGGGTSAAVRKELAQYFDGERKDFSCETRFCEGSEFERQVWDTLRKIPYGETRSYKWLADRIGRPGASRAVGNALGKNPIPIIFPCHRIIESDGSLGGYSSGAGLKRRLIEIEYYSIQSSCH